MKAIKEIHGLTAETFHRTVLPVAEPVVLRGLRPGEHRELTPTELGELLDAGRL